MKFTVADMPNADPFRLHIEASVAEEEGRKISERTRAALAAAKVNGTKLGRKRPGAHVFTAADKALSAERQTVPADAYAASITQQIADSTEGLSSLGSWPKD